MPSAPPNTNKRTPKKDKNEKGKIKIFNITFDFRSILLIIIVGYIIFSLFSIFRGEFSRIFPEKPLNVALEDIKKGKVEKIDIADNKAILKYKGSKDNYAIVYKETPDSFMKTFKEAGINPATINITINDTNANSGIMTVLGTLLPTLLMIGFFWFIFRQAKGSQEGIFSFGNNKSKRFNKDMPKTMFSDIAGVDEAKKELEEVVDFLKNPEKYKKVGARTPKGVLLVGPAGCGKTLLARAVAGEAGVPFFSIAGSEFMEMLVGIGAARARDLFAQAKQNSPAIIFIDEIDAIGRARATGVMPAHDEREQTLNQILVEMDGFEPNVQVIVIAATNRGDLLDPALLRPGRFDRRVIVDYPDVDGRKAILAIHAKGKTFAPDVDWEKAANRTVGFSGADLENMLNEAAICAARENRVAITSMDIEEAATKVKLGPEKKRLQTDYDRKLTAYHEAGHAMVSHFMPHTDPVHRISIVSRGMALGYTLIPPAKDKLHETKTHLLERLAVIMGGRAAEEVIFNEVTTGASNDFDQATRIARAMVVEFGMSSLGPVNYGPTMDVTEWGKDTYQQDAISQHTLSRIDNEVTTILENALKQAKEIVTANRKLMDIVATKLLATENMDSEQFEKIVGKKVNTSRFTGEDVGALRKIVTKKTMVKKTGASHTPPSATNTESATNTMPTEADKQPQPKT